MSLRLFAVLLPATLAGISLAAAQSSPQTPPLPQQVFGFHDYQTEQAKWDAAFLKVPDAQLAGEDLKVLTAAPHVAGTPEDFATAQYVEAKFRAAGLQTDIVKYTAWLNYPGEQHLTVLGRDGKVLLQGPTPEHVESDPFQDDPRVMPGFNSSSASGDATADVVYANYGTPEDFAELQKQGISVQGKIVLVQYGHNYRGVKAFIAQQHGAAGVLIYSDPADDGYKQGAVYPNGPYRPETGVQRGAIEYLFEYSGDVTTPGAASTPNLPMAKRIPADDAPAQPKIMALPISWHDAKPILETIGGPAVPGKWQGGLPFAYHMGGSGDVKVHLQLQQNYGWHSIWNVIGRIPGTDDRAAWVVAGNHRDAWTYGAVDPNSGTVAMLESVRGLGVLLRQGWRPRRTIIFGSWDAEEEGLVGSTEWAEQNQESLTRAVAYFNMDVAVSGPHFSAAAVPSLKNFIRDITREVPSPKGGSVYDDWQAQAAKHTSGDRHDAQSAAVPPIDDLGSGSDYTPFLQHLGVPSADMESSGDYGVYHSVFDNYAWFTKFADPHFVYEQQQARVFGLEVLHMADADVLPYDYVTYAQELRGYLQDAKAKADSMNLRLNIKDALDATKTLEEAAQGIYAMQQAAGKTGNTELNATLRQAETDLLNPAGLPNRPWYKHTIYAPGEYTGYAAVVIPGVNEALDAKDDALAQQQLGAVTQAITRCAGSLQTLTQATDQ